MVVYSVDVWVKKGQEENFIQATQLNHQETRKEEGNLRFDLLQSQEERGRFMLYEVYKNPEAVKAHKETEHYKIWRERVEPWMAQKRHGEQFTPLLPEKESQW